MPAPHRQALTLAFFEVASAHDGPPGIAGEHAPAGFDLVIEVHRPGELGEPSEDTHFPLEPARVDVLAVTGDVPATGEHQPRARCREVLHRLSSSPRVSVDSPGDQHGEHPVAPGHRCADDLAIVGRPGYDGDAPLERIELRDALLTAYADHLIAPAQRVLHHVLAELSGGSHDADLHHRCPSRRNMSGSTFQRSCDCAASPSAHPGPNGTASQGPRTPEKPRPVCSKDCPVTAVIKAGSGEGEPH